MFVTRKAPKPVSAARRLAPFDRRSYLHLGRRGGMSLTKSARALPRGPGPGQEIVDRTPPGRNRPPNGGGIDLWWWLRFIAALRGACARETRLNAGEWFRGVKHARGKQLPAPSTAGGRWAQTVMAGPAFLRHIPECVADDRGGVAVLTAVRPFRGASRLGADRKKPPPPAAAAGRRGLRALPLLRSGRG